jgi:hypothetical protein
LTGRRARGGRDLSASAALFLLFASVASGQSSDTRPEITPESAAEALLGDRAVVRKQASAWILEHPAEGIPALAAALAREPFSRFSFDGVRATGAIKDRRVSFALMRLLDDPNFRWRPQAFEALADHGVVDALPRLVAAANEPTWRSRAAACRGIATLRSKDHAELCRTLLDDDEAPVRLEAAKALWSFGDAGGLAHVVQDLSLDRRFFDADSGALARDAAAAFLNEVVGEKAFAVPSPVLDFQGLRAAVERVRSTLGDRAAAVQEIVPPHEPDVANLPYAIEVRSCVEGDLHLRFDVDGAVVVGRDKLLRATASKEATAALAREIDALDHGPRGRKIHGPISCDFERVGSRRDDAWRSTLFGEKRRPPEYDALEAALEKVVIEALGAPYAPLHAARARRFAADAAKKAPESGPAK